MKVFYDIRSIDVGTDKTSICMGTFDGLHIGHLEVLHTMMQTAREKQLKSLVYTFSNNPLDIIMPETAPKKIMTVDEKLEIFSQLSPDYIAIVEFGELQLRLTPEEFIQQVLIEKMKIAHVTVGHDFRFGKAASGNTDTLLEMGEKYGFGVTVIPPVTYEGERVSSTTIRRLLQEGRVREATALLSRNHFIGGEVIHGKGRGKKILSIPTINQRIKEPSYSMRCGVYFTYVESAGRRYNGITNIGYNPTFSEDPPELHVETYIYDFDQDIYGEYVKIHFIDWYREELRFSDVGSLKEQMKKDLEAGKKYFEQLEKM